MANNLAVAAWTYHKQNKSNTKLSKRSCQNVWYVYNSGHGIRGGISVVHLR
jgi:hypothetical protein